MLYFATLKSFETFASLEMGVGGNCETRPNNTSSGIYLMEAILNSDNIVCLHIEFQKECTSIHLLKIPTRVFCFLDKLGTSTATASGL